MTDKKGRARLREVRACGPGGGCRARGAWVGSSGDSLRWDPPRRLLALQRHPPHLRPPTLPQVSQKEARATKKPRQEQPPQHHGDWRARR